MRLFASSLVLVLLGAAPMAAAPTAAVPATAAGLEFFEKKIRPVLVKHCYACHSTQANKRRGGLMLDSREDLRKGGESGPALVPGKPDQSLLLRAVGYGDEMLKMPPTGKLPDALIADLRTWVQRGAPDPRDRATVRQTTPWEEVLRTRRTWWSLQPVRKPAPPPVKDGTWSDYPIDRFILARLEEKGLAPAAPTDPRTLIRRLSLVLTGLPPTIDEVAAFVKECGPLDPAGRIPPAAVEHLVDRLLASPHFGERWARHWLDVVRFSETHGNEWNYEVHHAWRYRDYLIRAFNEDVPYNQLVREHVAGDLLAAPRWNRKERFNESVLGTAFYRFGEVNHDDCITLPQIGFDLADNQLDTLTKAFQATTVACARCHDHKIDAVSMKDYHALLGILRSSRLVSHTLDAPEVNAPPMQALRELKVDIRKELGVIWLKQAREVSRYLPAAQARGTKAANAAALAQGLDPGRLDRWMTALFPKKVAPQDPLEPWRTLAAKPGDPGGCGRLWGQLGEKYSKEEGERAASARQYVTLADFRSGFKDWQVGGQGLRDGPTPSGDFVAGRGAVEAVLPAGCFTHTLSARLNGTLRSPVLARGKKYLSLQVLGRHSSAVRLVSNNCQLNYKNYHALTADALHWVTFELPDEADSLRVYAELMTKFDNPKFPDQLSGLGGDPANYRVPWEKAAADPRSFFGVTRVVLHDGPEPPRPERGHLRPLFVADLSAPLGSPADVAGRYAAVVEAAVRAWAGDHATDEDARWLDFFLRHGLLNGSLEQTPRLAELGKRYGQVEETLSLPRIAPGVADFGPGFEQPVLTRGDCTRPGEAAPRRYLEVLSKASERFAATGSGRRELAERLASPDNPLTARVMVNRIWHHLFGAGLVRTVDDFGRLGDLPSHPELLDYLAARFVEDGWSVKRLVRALVLTRTFQLSHRPAPASREADPQNRLLQHYPARRLEAEAIRDAILAASGRLDRTLYGPSIQPYRDREIADRRLFMGPLDGHGRRSVYIKNNLMEAPHFLSAFNVPGGKVAQGRRDVTNVPAQALALLNDPFILQQAEVWARDLSRRTGAVARTTDTVAGRIEYLFQTALGRPPSPEERKRFEQAVRELAELHRVSDAGTLTSLPVWKDLAHAMFNLQEMIYIP